MPKEPEADSIRSSPAKLNNSNNPFQDIFKDFNPTAWDVARQAGSHVRPARETQPIGNGAVSPYPVAETAPLLHFEPEVWAATPPEAASIAVYPAVQPQPASQASGAQLTAAPFAPVAPRLSSKSGLAYLKVILGTSHAARASLNNFRLTDRWAYFFALVGLMLTLFIMAMLLRNTSSIQGNADFYQMSQPWTEDQPHPVLAGQPEVAMVAISNNASVQRIFWVEARAGGQLVGVSGPFLLKPNETIYTAVEFRLPQASEKIALDVDLFRGTNDSQPFRKLKLWLTVDSPT